MLATNRTNPWLAGWSGLCLCLLVGCGEPDYYTCSGTVTHDGKPIPHLQITFEPEILDSVRPPICMSREDGSFEMTSGRELGVPPGKYKVLIEDPGAADGRKTSTEPDYLYVIDRYSPQKSDLVYEANQNQSNYELKLDTKEYTGPDVKQMEIRNTTDPTAK